MKPEIVITDFDGTLLNSNREVSEQNLKALEELGNQNIIRVIDTGRSMYSIQRDTNEKLPVDYIIFSSGAGIYDWKNKEIINSWHIDLNLVKNAFNILMEVSIPFFIHQKIPSNHKFYYYKNGGHPDFTRRLKLYSDFAKKIKRPDNFTCFDASQLLGITDHSKQLYDRINSELENLNVIRATSPLDNKSMWIEIFANKVSKAHSCQKLIQSLDISMNKTAGIGNDYNDIELLNWVQEPFVVENAPEDLKEEYNIVKSNDNNGFSDAVYKLMD